MFIHVCTVGSFFRALALLAIPPTSCSPSPHITMAPIKTINTRSATRKAQAKIRAMGERPAVSEGREASVAADAGAAESTTENPLATVEAGSKKSRSAKTKPAAKAKPAAKRAKKPQRVLPVCYSFILNSFPLLMTTQKLTAADKVSLPVVGGPIDMAGTTSETRSHEARKNKTVKGSRRRIRAFLEEAPTFQVPWYLNDIANDSGNDVKDELEAVCNGELGPGTPEQCFSAKFVDLSGKLIFAYLGYRIATNIPALEVSMARVASFFIITLCFPRFHYRWVYSTMNERGPISTNKKGKGRRWGNLYMSSATVSP